MLFDEPLWLLLLLVLPAALFWGWRRVRVRLSPGRLRAVKLLRAVGLLLLVLALAGLTAWWREDRLTVLFAVDASRSVGLEARAEALRFLEEASGNLPPGDLAGVLVFGAEAMVDTLPGRDWRAGEVLARPGADGTDLEAVVQLARGLFPPGHEARLVLLTDGLETTGRVEDALLGDADPPDLAWVPLASSQERDVLVERVTAPERVVEGEPHRVRVVLRASHPTEATLRVFRGPSPVAASRVKIEPGRPNVFAFDQVAPPGSGILLYRARVETETDATLDNNRASTLVRVEGRPRVLILDRDPASMAPLKAALEAADMEVEVSRSGGLPGSALSLAAWDAVVLADLPATDLSDGQMEALRTWVEAVGGGLLMLGGPDSFGPGGYWHTPVEEVLPVDTEIKDRTYFPSLGLVVCLDKSGSMAGYAGESKIEVAKAAAAEVAGLLVGQDRMGLVAFDAAAKWVVPMMAGGEVDAFIRRLGTLRAGGGTDAYPALVEARKALGRTEVRIKHVMLLTDGQLQSRNFRGLLKKMSEEKITVSTVAIGTDADLHTLESIAKWGDGRFYVAEDIDRLPRIFIREAFHVARSAVVEEPFQPVVRESHPALMGLDLSGAPPLLGYVGAAEKTAARHPLATPNGDPLLSLWRTGLGKSVAFTSDAKGRWAADWLGWEGYAPFWARLVRWARREEAPDRLRVAIQTERGALTIAADLMDDRGSFVNGADMRGIIAGPDGARREVRLQQAGPGRYTATVETTEPGPYLAAVFHQEATGPGRGATATTVVPYSDEFRSLGRTAEGLERLVESGKARIVKDPKQIFAHRKAGGRVRKELAPWLLAAVACLLLLEVAARKAQVPAWLLQRGAAAAAARQAAPDERLAVLQRARERAARRMEPAPIEGAAAPASVGVEVPEFPAPGAAPDEAEPPAPSETAPAPSGGEEDLASRLLAAKKRRRR